MANLFTRALSPGNAPGMQVNGLIDNSEITADRRDEFFAGILKLPRGRIDRSFLVTPGNVFAKIGNGAWLGKTTWAYKSHVAVVEALKNGASGAVLQRLSGSGATNKFIVVKAGTSIALSHTIKNGVIKTVTVTANGSGYGHPALSIGTYGPVTAGFSIDVNINCTTGAIVGFNVNGSYTTTGFANDDAVTLTDDSGGTGFTGHLTNVTDGTLTGAKVAITTAGTGYARPTITKSSGPGSAAVFIARMRITGAWTGKLVGVSVANAGYDYATITAATPSVLTITDPGSYGGGTGATATITDTDDGVITAIATPTNVSGDYLNSIPTISIKNTNGGNGAGAAATAAVTGGDISLVTVTAGGTGYVSGKVSVTANLATNPQFFLRGSLPNPEDEPYLFAIKDMECFNNGIIVALHCDGKSNASGDLVDTARITVRIIDPALPRRHRYEFTGNLTDNGLDDFGGSTFLPDVVSRKTDNIVVYVGADAIVSKNSLMYGLNNEGNEKWVRSDTLKAFSEGSAVYGEVEYIAARNKLVSTPLNFQYLSSLDTDSTALIAQLAKASYLTNRNLRFDVQGDTVAEAIGFMNTLNFIEREENHLLHAFWAPQSCEDPTGQNGSLQMGSATLNIAFACARNARKDSRGFAPKHYPIMGKDWALSNARKNIRSPFTLGRGALNALAIAKINPVIYEDGRYIFSNAITCANVDVSLRKLIAVTDMSTSIDDAVVRFCSGVKGYPIDEAVKMTKDYLKELFEGAEAAGWIVPSQEPEMQGKSFRYEVLVDPDRPYDTFNVGYYLRYQGTALYIYITQAYTS